MTGCLASQNPAKDGRVTSTARAVLWTAAGFTNAPVLVIESEVVRHATAYINGLDPGLTDGTSKAGISRRVEATRMSPIN